jgi:dTDP-4-dehydrorhamnose reductase
VLNNSKAITLRTSIIGHELRGNHSLINWFLSQHGSVTGYKKAIFSGLPTVELARVIRDFVLPNDGISGLYHVSADPISKFDLLKIVAEEYGKEIELVPSEDYVIDRSLDSSKFQLTTGYKTESWEMLIRKMREFN